jgi:type I site-specific restriction endonuclease
MARLLAGDLDAVVQVATLVEGFDGPAIDLIALRRPMIDSIARFVQLIGRGARCSPDTGKRDCVLLNPCGIRIVEELGRAADLGAAMEELARAADDLREPLDEIPERVRVATMAVTVTELRAWLQRIAHGLVIADGVQIRAYTYSVTGTQAASERQRQHLAAFATDRRKSPIRLLPETVRDAMYALVECADVMDRQTASDILGILFAVRSAFVSCHERTGSWVWRPAGLDDVPALPTTVLDGLIAERRAVAHGEIAYFAASRRDDVGANRET